MTILTPVQERQFQLAQAASKRQFVGTRVLVCFGVVVSLSLIGWLMQSYPQQAQVFGTHLIRFFIFTALMISVFGVATGIGSCLLSSRISQQQEKKKKHD